MSLLPKYETKLAAGIDLPAAEFITIPASGSAVVDTGLKLSDLLTPTDLAWPVPSGCLLYAEIRSRSGLAFRHGVHAFHGVIDLDYKDNIKVLLTNTGKEKFDIHPSDRVAQLVFGITYRPAHLLSTEERTGGFGSTGE